MPIQYCKLNVLNTIDPPKTTNLFSVFYTDPNNSTINADMMSYIYQLENLQTENYVTRYNMSTWERPLPDWKSKYEMLCRGDYVYRVRQYKHDDEISS